jgi:glycerophosphoryl diester phosphodiesterase
MRHFAVLVLSCLTLAVPSSGAAAPPPGGRTDDSGARRDDPFPDRRDAAVELGPRPFYLVNKLEDGPLKTRLQQCEKGPFHRTPFAIGHRGGATLQFPEHTREDHEAGARMGAGILECDVTFTKDGQLVCRHDQCDLHTTTNILVSPLAARCTEPFTPAQFDAAGRRTAPASALCCTSDLTLAEFVTLKGKMDASDPSARTPAEFLGGTPSFRTDLYATGGTLLTHRDSIRLIRSLDAKFTPELKGPNRSARVQVEDVFGSQQAYAQALVDEYKAAKISPADVFAQSFNRADILYWIEHEPAFGRQAVFLDDRYDTGTPKLNPKDPRTFVPSMAELRAQGVRIVAPPIWVLLEVENGRIVPSAYARAARAAGLDIITWTLERSGRIAEDVLPTKGTANPEFYYQSTLDAIRNDGDILVALDVLAQQVGIIGIFSDWAATVTYYANCMKR